MIDDSAAVRAQEEYVEVLSDLNANNLVKAAKNVGILSHYIVDMAVFGHVMGSGTDWGAEVHHSDYETYVDTRTDSYYDDLNVYLSFDGKLNNVPAYNAALLLAYDTTFDIDGDLTCVWMDNNYDWNNPTFKDRCGESLNFAVNCLTDVLHTLYIESSQAPPPPPPSDTTPPSISNVKREPMNPKPSEQVTISATVTDESSGVDKVTLYYRLEGGSWVSTLMSRADNLWSASISGQEDGVKVYYYVEAVDKAGNQKETSIYDYTVSKISSSITCSLSKTTMTLREELTVSGSISPPHPDVTVTLTYTRSEGSIERTVRTGSDGCFTDNYTPDAAGSWSVKASWTGDWDHKGASSAIVSFIVEETLKLSPEASFTYSPTTNLSIIVTINFEDKSTDPDGNIVSWLWDFGDNVTSNDQNPIHKYGNKGTYTVNLTVTDNDGLVDTKIQQIFILNLPPTVEFAYSPETLTVGQEVNFTDESEDPEGRTLSYSWDFDDGSKSTERNPSHKYEEPGTYTVKLTVTDDEGEKATGSITITVTKLSTVITCSISSSEVTQGDSITVSGAINPAVSDKTVTLTYKKPDGSTHNRTVTTGSDGGYSDTHQLDAIGSWSVTASWNGDSRHEGAFSLPEPFNVKQKPFASTTEESIAIIGVVVTIVVIILIVLKRR